RVQPPVSDRWPTFDATGAQVSILRINAVGEVSMTRSGIAASTVVCCMALVAIGPAEVSSQTGSRSRNLRWYKGNTHAHTVNTDGDSTPDDVARWYKEQRYNFVVLTDHNSITNVDGLNAVHASTEAFNPFLVIRGEEVTDTFFDKAAHVEGKTG